MTSHQLVNGTNSDVEYFTPQEIIEAARRTMGAIDLDPASSHQANERVKADNYFTFANDAMSRVWCSEHTTSRVFLNHPFGRAETVCAPQCTKNHVHHAYPLHGNAAWINKLRAEWMAGNVSQVCCITFAATSENWFQPLLAFPQCFLHPRTNYLLPDGTIKKGVTKGSVVTYLGPEVNKFAQEFRSMGTIKVQV